MAVFRYSEAFFCRVAMSSLFPFPSLVDWGFYNRKNEMSIFQKRNEQIFSFFASFFLLLFRPLKHQLKADFKPLKQA